MQKHGLILGLVVLLAGPSITGCMVPETHRTFSKDRLSQIARSPSRHAGQLYAFQGRVISATEEDGLLAFQMLAADHRRDFGGGSLFVMTTLTSLPVARDHDVRVLGRSGGSLEGTNAFGGSVSSITMKAIAIWDMTANRIAWDDSEEDTYRKWESGELFAPRQSR